MALPDFFKTEFGTAVVWGTASGTGPVVTDILTLNNLANNASRMGASVDLGAQWEEQALWLYIETGTAPAAGELYFLYMAVARVSSGEWPGGVTGSDAAFQTTEAANDEHLRQFGLPNIVLPATNDTNASQRSNYRRWMPGGQFVVPIVYNHSGQALRDQGTPAANTSRVIMQPLRSLIQDAA